MGCALTAVVFLVILPALGEDSAPGGNPIIRLEPSPPALALSDQQDAPDHSRPPDEHSGDEADGPGLSTLQGLLARCGDRHCIDGTILDFGPPWYLASTVAPANFDGDSEVETLDGEIRGLVGATIAVTVRPGRLGEADVFAIDGIFYRDPHSPPPWAGPPPWALDSPERIGPSPQPPAEETEGDRSSSREPAGRPQLTPPRDPGDPPPRTGGGHPEYAGGKAGQSAQVPARAAAPTRPGHGSPDQIPAAGVPSKGRP